MRLVFVMDPPARVNPDSDTSFALMLEAQARGARVDHCLPQDLVLRSGKLSASVRRATLARDVPVPLALGEAEDVDLEQVDAIFVRKDPPFDPAYLWTTLLLEAVRGKTLVVNDPRGLRDANEKLYTCNFPELMPETLVASARDRIRSFVHDVGGRAVIKPLDGAGGEGVMALSENDPNFRAIVDLVTANGSRVAMVQRFLPEYTLGDKRILLVDGEPIGAVLRVPRKDDIASNLRMGGSAHASDVDAADRRIIDALAPRLVRDGLHFVGIDVIGGYLTEVNVTSPTGIQQMSRLNGENVPGRVLDWLARKLSA
jgi:glutathione synthase